MKRTFSTELAYVFGSGLTLISPGMLLEKAFRSI